MNAFELTDKIILITGASSGIGRQCAIRCSMAGATVILTGRNLERLEESLRQTNLPEKHLIYPADLTDPNQINQLVTEIVQQKERINGVIHCAGISTTLPLKLVSPDKLDTFFQSNVFSAFNLTREVCKTGCFSIDGGSIIFISSIMGCVGEKGKSLYSMTKGALLAGTKSLACELAKKKIRVNAISPGAIITPINKQLPHIADPEKRKELEDKHLLGLGSVDDVANACIYLLSDASRWVTGINLIVDGGYTAK